MLDAAELEDAVDLQQRSYELLLWVGRAIERGFIAVDKAHKYSSGRASAYEWLERHYFSMPDSCRPSARSGEALERYANVFSSYLLTSFEIDSSPGYKGESPYGCRCEFCSRLVRASHLRTKRVTRRDKKRAQELKNAYVAELAREHGHSAAPERIGRVLSDERLSHEAALATYGKELLSRCRGGGSSGTPVLALWREFAWTAQGSPNPRFRLRAADILKAEQDLLRALAA